MATKKSVSEPAKYVRKKYVTVQEIREAVSRIDDARATIEVALKELDDQHIVGMSFDGVGWAARALDALKSYGAAVRGAIHDPRSEKTFAEREGGTPSRGTKGSR